MNQDGTSLSLQPTIKAHMSQWPEEARPLDCVATNGVTSTQHPGKQPQHPPYDNQHTGKLHFKRFFFYFLILLIFYQH